MLPIHVTGFRIALLAYTAALWLPGLFCLWRIPRCPATGPRADSRCPAVRRRVSVIVPARNEERRIAPLLESLDRQNRRVDEILVVDDGSTDGTAMLARRLGAKVIAAGVTPGGWTGKNWACWSGARAARGNLFVFLDADVRIADGGLERLLAAHAERGGLVSAQPYHEVPRAYERLSAFCNVVIMGSLGAFTPLGDRMRVAGSFGPCIVVARDDYLACGGHAAVRDLVVEDMALGAEARRRGLQVACLGGRGALSFRMYPDGIRSLAEGWSKNMATGAGGAPPLTRALMSAWITGATTAVITLVMGIAALADRGAGNRAGGPPFGAAAVGLYGLYAAQLYWMLRRIGTFGPWPALLFPLPLAFFHAIFARSVWLAKVRGSVTWKGRRIWVRTRRCRNVGRRTSG
jgi:4,4'-diaponeurosporenoate glycosyltransferase